MVSVLVVDDAPELAEGLGALLSLDGYRVRTATSGAQAQRLVREEIPDALLSDIEMPDMDGLALGRWVRREFQERICLVAISGAVDRLDEAREIFDFSVAKPLAYKALVDLLKHTYKV